MSFSKRYGFKEDDIIYQKEGMSKDLRNSLWNALDETYWSKMQGHKYLTENQDMEFLFTRLWRDFFKYDIDTLNNFWKDLHVKIRNHFQSAQWFEIYDLIEFVSNNFPLDKEESNKKFKKICNFYLEREKSAYRFIGNNVVETTSEIEIKEIEKLLKREDLINEIGKDIKKASSFIFNQRENSDFKEPIMLITKAFNEFERFMDMNISLPVLEFEEKIEHILKDTPEIDKLVLCIRDMFVKLKEINESDIPVSGKIEYEDVRFILVQTVTYMNFFLQKMSKDH